MSTISGVNSSGDAWANMKAQRGQMQGKMFAKVDTDSSGGVDKAEFQSLIDDVAKKTGVTNSSTDALFSKMDTNSDGSLAADELGKGMKEILPPPSTLAFAQSRSATTATGGNDDRFTKVDTDGNGAVSQDEFQALNHKKNAENGSTATSSDKFAKLDSNQDGSLDKAEFDAGRPDTNKGTQGNHGAKGAGGPPPPGGAGGASSSTTYDPLDSNEDGTVSAAERLAGSTSTDAVQALFKAIDTNSDSKISAAESGDFMAQLTAQQAGTTPTSSSSTEANSTLSNVDLAELVKQAYEQIANNMTQQTTGSSLSALA